MVNDDRQLRLDNASYVVSKLEKMFELVEPTEKFKKLNEVVGGDTILDSVTNYIMYYGYTPELSAMFVEQRQIYLKEKNKSVLQKCAENSISSLGAKVEQGKKSVIEFAKKNYKSAIAVLLSAAIIASSGLAIRSVVRKNDLENAGENIITTYNQEFNYFESLSEIQVEEDFVRIPESDFQIFLLQHNFTKDEIIYLTNKYDKVSFDKVINYYGYSNLDDYLSDYYFNAHYSGSENPTILYRTPNYRKFENAVEESIKDKAELLKSYYEKDVENSKGKGSK